MADAGEAHSTTGPDLAQPTRVHIVGIGGAGMSAIATVLMAMGHRVSGSDAADSQRLRRLEAAGARVHIGHDAGALDDAQVVAVSTAIPPSNVEVVAATQQGLRVWRRAEILAAICANRRTVAIAGTHGKTTTSAMLATILRSTGQRPSYIIGGDLIGAGPSAAWERGSEWLVVEADESDGTFLQLAAEAVLVTSVEPDHLDFYGDEVALYAAFDGFISAASGPKVLCADDPRVMSLAAVRQGTDALSERVVTYGTNEAATVRVEEVTVGRDASAFSIRSAGTAAGPFQVAAPGLHNVRNAAAAVAMAHALGMPWDDAGRALAGYRGVARRFERRGEQNGITFIDDYGHLPGEVAAALVTAAAGGWGRVVAVFQPHRYTRTASLWRDFSDAFCGADVLLVTDIYSAGEPPLAGITGRLIADAVATAHPGTDVRYVPTLDDVTTELRRTLQPGDLCLTLGAGDLTILPDRFLQPKAGC